jgi:molecular chaperone GrpE
MIKNKKSHEKKSDLENEIDATKASTPENSEQEVKGENSVEETINHELEGIKAQLGDKAKQCDDYLVMLQRTAAEFDNYKKRTAKEKEALYSDAVSDSVLAFLPVIDNLERALLASEVSDEGKLLKNGVELVFRQMKDVMKNFGVEEVKGVGEKFDPLLHNAVMHIEDGNYGENTIVEEFQKGYILKGKVIRHSMVKVAN